MAGRLSRGTIAPVPRLLPIVLLLLLTAMAGRSSAARDFEWPAHLVPVETAVARAIEQATASQAWESSPTVRITLPGVPNAWRLHPNVFVGDAPPGPEAMAVLRREHRVLTLVCLDQIPPNQGAALDNLLATIHFPLRAGRVPTGEFAALLGALSHNLPAFFLYGAEGDVRALAAGAMVVNIWDRAGPPRALALMHRLGVPRQEIGLWYDAASELVWRGYDDGLLVPKEFPPRREPAPLVSWMRTLDESFVRLREASEYDWSPAPGVVGTTPEYDARTLAGTAGDWVEAHPQAADEVRDRIAELRTLADDLARALNEQQVPRARDAWSSLADACRRCHQTFRDQP
ncbi:MAG: cytochrome c [Candidatus Sumerlaeia bacterium]|nr:cytochrome c [Candidatus Sumerlaeia bacterium]